MPNNNRRGKNDNKKRGFAAMKEDDPEKQRQIASEGGKTSHANGTAHEFQEGSEEAREAGRKGGESRGRNTSSVDESMNEENE